MNKKIFFSILLILLLVAPVLAAEYDNKNEEEIEKIAINSLYSTAKQMADNADKINPMTDGKFDANLLGLKKSLVQGAIEALSYITEDSKLKTNEGEPYKKTFDNAANAKKRLEGTLKELQAVETDGNVKDGGLLGLFD